MQRIEIDRGTTVDLGELSTAAVISERYAPVTGAPRDLRGVNPLVGKWRNARVLQVARSMWIKVCSADPGLLIACSPILDIPEVTVRFSGAVGAHVKAGHDIPVQFPKLAALQVRGILPAEEIQAEKVELVSRM